MAKISNFKIIPFSKKEVWAVLEDYANIDKVSPGVSHSFALGSEEKGLGAKRQCELDFGTIREVVTKWEEEERLEVKIYDGEKLPPMKDFYGNFVLEDALGGTKLTFTIRYKMGLGPIGWLMSNLMMKPKFKKGTHHLLVGIEHYLTTGTKIKASELSSAS